jgi:serine/threonine protein kinase
MPTVTSCRAGVALVIGVGEYLRAERVEPLRFAARDAEALADTLADPELCAFPADQVVLLTDRDARRDEVVQRLSKWLPERARHAEVVFIYFAGHGMVQTVGRREEGFLLPYDADPDDVVTRGIAMSDIARWIDGLDSRAVVVCLDCCHAGKMLGQRGVAPEPIPAGRNMELKPAVLERMSGRGRYLIASCDEGQKSFECAELGHGLFTFHLIQGIAGAADSDGDGRVGLAELFNFVSVAVSRDARIRFGYDQKPWTSATWAEETYISSPPHRTAVQAADPLERLWREQGAAAAVREIERTLPEADDKNLQWSLRFLGRLKEPAGVPILFRCLAHSSEAVRNEARAGVHALGWETVVGVVEGFARRADPVMGAVLDGLNAFESHPEVLRLLDRLIVLLTGELRNRAILLREHKELGQRLLWVTDLFKVNRSPYRIERVLGQGLFTATYLAIDEGTGLQVVVRVLRPEFANQPQVRAQFLDLCHQSVRLIHENLALTREARAFPDWNIYYAVRDYIPGVTLQRVLEAGKRFEPLQGVRILREVAKALTPLHRKGACHGGIKPSNIFLCEGGGVMLGDAMMPLRGVGLALDRLAYDYLYTPPEVFQSGGVVGPAGDFYALGCVAYELLCGQPPFVSDNFHELAARHIDGSIPLPSRRGSRLGEAGDAAVLKFLARAPAERYGTLNEVLLQLDTLEHALLVPASGGLSVPAAVSPPLLRDASLVNYAGVQSVLHFEESGLTRDEFRRLSDQEVNLPLGIPAASADAALQVPGYAILEKLGQGGMGAVYKAQDVSLNRVVALKVIRAGLKDEPERLARFRTEAMAIARLDHPNIVSIHTQVEHEGMICLVLRYVEGGDLAHKLRELVNHGKYMPLRDAAVLMVKLARAVAFAHQNGVLHRDLKPSNILLTREGEPQISDFGLAKQLSDSWDAPEVTKSGQILGTPAYMAPEQAGGSSGDKVGPAADVYALGTIFFELLTGRKPFEGDHGLEVLVRIKSEEPTPPRRLRPEIPRELESVCLKCLSKDPARRYPTAAALAEDLERWLQGKPLACRPQGFWRRLFRFFSFNR